jgi:hypothetical protein
MTFIEFLIIILIVNFVIIFRHLMTFGLRDYKILKWMLVLINIMIIIIYLALLKRTPLV